MSESTTGQPASSNVSSQHLVLAIVGMTAVILGLMNEDLMLNYAVFGPLMVFSMGALVLMVLIESRHVSSHPLDSFIFYKVGAESSQDYKATRFHLSVGISTLSLLFALLSIFFVAKFNPTGFALSLFFSMTLMGLSIGRSFGSSIGQESSNPRWLQLSAKDRLREIEALRTWLRDDWNSSLSRIQENKIDEQKMMFRNHIILILGVESSANATLSSLDEAKDIESMLVESMRSENTDWFNDTMDHFTKVDHFTKESDLKDSLLSLLLLPVITELLGHMARHDSGSDVLFDRLLSLVGKYAIRLDCDDIFDIDIRLMAISGISTQRSEELQRFIKLVATSAAEHEQFNWSPWWVLNLRSRMDILMESHEWKGIESSYLTPFAKDVTSSFSDWCFMLSEFDSVRQGGTSEISAQIKQVLEKIKPSSHSMPIIGVLKITWLAHLKLPQ